MTTNVWVIANTKQRMRITEAIKWFNCANTTIIHAKRMSNRGKFEDIYILGAYGTYGHKGETFDYVTDTGLGYGGRGALLIKNVMTSDISGRIMSTEDIMSINEKRTFPIWVFK